MSVRVDWARCVAYWACADCGGIATMRCADAGDLRMPTGWAQLDDGHRCHLCRFDEIVLSLLGPAHQPRSSA